MIIIHGDCLSELKKLDENSVDAVVTDPPYGWSFMGKAWDSFAIEKRRVQEFNRPPRKDGKSRGRGDPSLCAGLYNQSLEGNRQFQLFTEAYARELYRVLKPGGHMLVFCGPRTYHRMASGVEDAGFEIRDQLQWLFGSGFPKSHDISKGIDKAAGAEREVVGVKQKTRADNPASGSKRGGNSETFGGGPGHDEYLETAPATADAKQWQGWGTALKPANEPIVLARKPLSESTVAKNVLRWGVGGLNIDASRISPQGRWPANLLLDETAAEMLDEQSGVSPSNKRKSKGNIENAKTRNQIFPVGGTGNAPNDSGGASRFFYCAKSSKSERNAGLEGMPIKIEGDGRATVNPRGMDSLNPSPQQNFHPTVKPIKLMEYLIRLITPPNGIVLDPFMGSGSTGVAAKNLGFGFTGIELNKEYVEIAGRRIAHASGGQALTQELEKMEVSE